VSGDLLPCWGAAHPVPFGELVTLVVGAKPIRSISTTWPGREVNKPIAKDIQVLFSGLGLPTWN
jgi:hypothetical protein